MKKLYFIAALPLVLAGCIDREVKVNPDVAVPDKFANAKLADGSDAKALAFWDGFGDPQLSALVRKALDNNRSLKAAEASVSEARANRKAAIANLLPSVAASGQLQHQETLVNPDGATNASLYGIGAQWDLDLFGQNRNIARANTQLQYAEAEQYLGTRMTIASETAKAYLTWQNVQARLAVLRKVIAIQRHTYELVQGRLPEGLSSTFDVDRAKAQLAGTEALLPQLEMADAKLRAALAVLTGEPATSFKVDAGAGWTSVKVPEPPTLLPSTVLERRPDVQAAKHTVEAQMFAVGAAKSAYFPKFTFSMLAGEEYLRFSPYLIGATTKHGMGDYRSFNGPVTDGSLSATLPIFTFGKIRDEVKKQEARLDAVAALYENTILQAVADVETSYTSYAQTGKREGYLGESAKSAASAADKAEGLYEGGLADMTDVLSAQASSQEQQDAYLQGALEHAVAAIALHDALGSYGDEIAPKDQKALPKDAAKTQK
jgi:NodT family efflux transporter outer membrane factor (OMF) lipoprotein